jgi:hypothetical protein
LCFPTAINAPEIVSLIFFFWVRSGVLEAAAYIFLDARVVRERGC